MGLILPRWGLLLPRIPPPTHVLYSAVTHPFLGYVNEMWEYSLGNLNPNWATCLKSGQNFIEVGIIHLNHYYWALIVFDCKPARFSQHWLCEGQGTLQQGSVSCCSTVANCLEHALACTLWVLGEQKEFEEMRLLLIGRISRLSACWNPFLVQILYLHSWLLPVQSKVSNPSKVGG